MHKSKSKVARAPRARSKPSKKSKWKVIYAYLLPETHAKAVREAAKMRMSLSAYVDALISNAP